MGWPPKTCDFQHLGMEAAAAGQLLNHLKHPAALQGLLRHNKACTHNGALCDEAGGERSQPHGHAHGLPATQGWLWSHIIKAANVPYIHDTRHAKITLRGLLLRCCPHPQAATEQYTANSYGEQEVTQNRCRDWPLAFSSQ